MEERKGKKITELFKYRNKKLSVLNSRESMNKKFVNTQDHLH